MEFKKYEGKRIKVVLLNNYIYQGEVLKADDDWIEMLDKYNDEKLISTKSISTVEELKR